ncbi:MAG: hypothetical protein RIQ60_649 [Pseudomonadota bacterium]|jgi:signal transduction histidine kinase
MLPSPDESKRPAQVLRSVSARAAGPVVSAVPSRRDNSLHAAAPSDPPPVRRSTAIVPALQMAGLVSIAALSLGCAAVGLALDLTGNVRAGDRLGGFGIPVLIGFALLGWMCLAVVWRRGFSAAGATPGTPASALVSSGVTTRAAFGTAAGLDDAPSGAQVTGPSTSSTPSSQVMPLPVTRPTAAHPALADTGGLSMAMAPVLARLIDALPGRTLLAGRELADGPWLLVHAREQVHPHADDGSGSRRQRPAGPPYPELASALQDKTDWPLSPILQALGSKQRGDSEALTAPTDLAASSTVRVLPLDPRWAVIWLPPAASDAAPTSAAAAAAAAQADAERDSFLFSVSHDLRAPIRVIDGFTRILKEDYGATLDRIGNDHLDRVLGASARMSAMIDALLGLSRLSTRALQRTRVDLSEMAEQVMDELRRQTPQRQAQITIQPAMTVQGDATLLRTVLDNLLGNAWKYSAKRELTRIDFNVSTDESGRHIFRLSDNGAGFDMRFAERLFGPFQRLHSASEFAGTGVGLASVRRIVHRHGGDIWAEAEIDRGATFCFTLGD